MESGTQFTSSLYKKSCRLVGMAEMAKLASAAADDMASTHESDGESEDESHPIERILERGKDPENDKKWMYKTQ